jgi:hypothetical protein
MKPTDFFHCGVQKVIKIGKSYQCLVCKTFFTKKAIELRQTTFSTGVVKR